MTNFHSLLKRVQSALGADHGPRRRPGWRPSLEYLEARTVPSASGWGDFNHDGYADLAIGAPGATVNGKASAGSVTVIYGSATGLSGTSSQLLTQDSLKIVDPRTGLVDPSEAGDQFGWSLAVGDFNHDGYADLAVGTPGEDDGPDTGDVDSGCVNVIYGGTGGLAAANGPGAQYWSQETPGIRHKSSRDDAMGYAVAAGDVNGDGYDDLVVGTPNNTGGSTNTFYESGLVQVIYGSARGVNPSQGHDDQAFDLSEVDPPNSASYDHLGTSLAVGDFNGDGFADIAAGLPDKDVGSKTDAGSVLILYGSPRGPSPTTGPGFQLWTQDSVNIQGAAQQNDHFGAALAAGDFNGDGFTDLAVGVPGEDITTSTGQVFVNSGAVNVLFGSATGGLTAANNQLMAPGRLKVKGAPSADAGFGSALLAGDFNGDGKADLVIGAPGALVNGVAAGMAYVSYGSAVGFGTITGNAFSSNTGGVKGTADAGDQFGASFTAGDFNGDGRLDLAVGIPHDTVGMVLDAGAVVVLLNSASGLSGSGSQFWSAAALNVPGAPESGALFGAALGWRRS